MSNKLITIPNLLTLVRLLCVPFVAILIGQNEMLWAFGLFLFACITDLFDGYLARKYQWISKLGIWLDPLADKLMAVTVLLLFVLKGIVPWGVVAIVAGKEAIMLFGGLVVLRKGGVTPSNKFGKLVAFLMNVAIASGFFHQWFAPYDVWAMWLMAGLTVVAMLQYGIRNRKLIFGKIETQA